MEVKKMKKSLLLLLCLALILGVAAIVMAGETYPGVAGTPHDVRVMTGQDGLEPCAMCHTPHSGTGDYPLWNRDQGPQTYSMYNSPSFDMGPTQTGPEPPSSLCLVCHNGVFSSLVNYPGPGSPANESYDYEMNPTFWAMLGTDLTDDHPISFTYDPTKDSVQDGNGFPDVITCLTGINTRYWIGSLSGGDTEGNNNLWYPLYTNSEGQQRQMECATCHSVHDTVDYYGKQLVGGKSVGTQVFFLRHTNQGSQMCGDCHINRLTGGTFTRTSHTVTTGE
jgi:hypothetical protein